MRLIIAIVVNVALLLLWPVLALRRVRAAPRGSFLEATIDGAVVEMRRSVPFWDRRPRPLSLQGLREVVDLMRHDARVAGLLLTIRSVSAGSATAMALREVLLAARAAGKRVVAHLPSGGGTRELLVASAADTILLGPETYLGPLGFSVEAPYFKRALDLAGLEAEVFAREKYKTAAEPMVASSMSQHQREQLDRVLEVAWDTLLDALASGRNVDRERAREWVDRAPWSSKAAVAGGLADAEMYRDDVAKYLNPSSDKGAPVIGARRYMKRRRIRFRPILPRPCLAVVEVHGPIVSHDPGRILPMAEEGHVRDALRRVASDHRAKGVVVHINSRGGSALASDRMLREVRRLAEKKPVVAYLSDAAASGGYMVAVGAQWIVAQPTTITGSIGVISARIIVGPLMRRLGIETEVVKRGARADMGSPTRPLDDGERAVVERQMDEVYESFLRAVATGRQRELEEIRAVAGGRVWSGRDAVAHGLVDQLGGFDAALAQLRTRIGPAAYALGPVLYEARVTRPAALRLPKLLLVAARMLRLSYGLEAIALALAASSETVWAWQPWEED